MRLCIGRLGGAFIASGVRGRGVLLDKVDFEGIMGVPVKDWHGIGLDWSLRPSGFRKLLSVD